MSETNLRFKSLKFISDISLGNKSKSVIASLALAKVIAYSLPIPQEEVKTIATYHDVTNKLDVMDTLYRINELVPIAIEKTADLVSDLYAYRYEQLYPNAIFTLVGNITPIEDFFGITLHVAKVDLDVIKDNPLQLTEMTLGFKLLIAEESNDVY